MSGIARLMQMGAAGAGNHPAPLPIGIEDYFSTYLYTGNGSTQTITNGIDLDGEGGLVWLKARANTSASTGHALFDTERGRAYGLASQTTAAQLGPSASNSDFQSFNADGFTVAGNNQWALNINNFTYASWTFRKAPRFFDVVTWTGDNSGAKTVNHNLGLIPGFIVVKATSATNTWFSHHRSLGVNSWVSLNETQAVQTNANANWNPTQTTFEADNFFGINSTGVSYVAYLFAHDPLGPSGDGSDGLIACGSYTGTGAAGLEVNLGWEPQWFLMKRTDTAGSDWFIFDVMRGFTTDGDRILRANTSEAESDTTAFVPTPTGVKLLGTFSSVNASGGTYIYIAIRRGPMRAPTSGTEVFAVETSGAATEPRAVSGFPVDMAFRTDPAQTQVRSISARLTQGQFLLTTATDAEAATTNFEFDYNNGVSSLSLPAYYYWMFRRAPGFFDVVAYSGNSVAGRTVPHNLGVAPEMGIFKVRNNSQYNWNVYLASLGTSNGVTVNSNNASSGGLGGLLFNNTAPTSSEITLGDWAAINAAGNNYIAYLFATLPGVSKVGSYTGNGSSQTINCGFTTGARFILIKRTDSTGDWYVWDTARGIVTGNDPHLSLNTTAAEVTTDDSIDPDSSGFIVNQVAATNINVSSASYIFYAVA